MGNNISNQSFKNVNQLKNNPFISKKDLANITIKKYKYSKIFSYIVDRQNVINKFKKYMENEFSKISINSLNDIEKWKVYMEDNIEKYIHYKANFDRFDNKILDFHIAKLYSKPDIFLDNYHNELSIQKRKKFLKELYKVKNISTLNVLEYELIELVKNYTNKN